MSRQSTGWLFPAGLCLIIGISMSAPNLDKTQTLALERYGSQAAGTIIDWRKLIEESRNLEDDEKLKRVNLFFNRRLLFRSDKETWQQEDYWATPLESVGRSAGDCEDFTIAKYVALQMLGIGNDRLRLILVGRHPLSDGLILSRCLAKRDFYSQSLLRWLA